VVDEDVENVRRRIVILCKFCYGLRRKEKKKKKKKKKKIKKKIKKKKQKNK